MRALRDNQVCVCVCPQLSYPPTAQHSLVSHARQLWNDWEIQCLVLVSFSLQVFLLFSAVFRMRHRSTTLSVLLWLAYQSADSVAVYLLGRLTLLVGDNPRHQVVLFWAPLLLLHLGGQETITAFSMEDCMLWKRHLLNLVIQMSLAIYVVGKQWKGDKQLVAPTVLMFITGTIRYAERILALSRAQSTTSVTGSKPGFIVHALGPQPYTDTSGYQEMLRSIVLDKQERNFERVMEVANIGSLLSRDFFMDLIRPRPYLDYHQELWRRHRSSNDLADMVYKLADIHLSMIYDCLYTKFRGGLMGVLCRLSTFALTCIAFTLFLVSRLDHNGSSSYNRADATISYILLVGAFTLEISSVLLWLMSSYSTWNCLRALPRAAGTTLYKQIFKHLHPEIRVEWSGQLQQYNTIDWCIHEGTQAGYLERMMRCVGIERACTKPVKVSAEVKKLLIDKMLAEILDKPRELDLTRFHGQWAQRWVKRQYPNESAPSSSSESNLAQLALETSQIQDLAFVRSAFLWHLVTDICLEADTNDDESETTTSTSKLRSSCRELSNYVMYLVVKCEAMLSRVEHDSLSYRRYQMKSFYSGKYKTSGVDRRRLIQDIHNIHQLGLDNVFRHAYCVSEQLRKMEAVADRWELIATVWVEMVCYIAKNCGASLHAKQLCAGGEFVTHVKMLLLILSFPF